MKIHVEISGNYDEDEIIIRCKELTDDVKRVYKTLLDAASDMNALAFCKDEKEYFFPVSNVLFFETEGSTVYAHTENDAFSVRLRLYELQEILPSMFIRASKSALLNINRVYSIERNLAAGAKIGFLGSHKQLFVSRMYYKEFRLALNSRKPETNTE